jgi:hypothetical protein
VPLNVCPRPILPGPTAGAAGVPPAAAFTVESRYGAADSPRCSTAW